MRYRVFVSVDPRGETRHIVIEHAADEYTTFPAVVGNPAYDSFLESESLTDAEVQAMEPDVWHDMA